MDNQPMIPVEKRAMIALDTDNAVIRLNELAIQAREITSITNKDGYKQCHKARTVLKQTRVAIEAIGKSVRDDANKFSKAVIAEQRKLIAIIEPEETRLMGLQTQWDAAIEAEKQAKAAIEKARVDALISRIGALRKFPNGYHDSSSEEIKKAIEYVESIDVSEAQFFEFTSSAVEVKKSAILQLQYTLVQQEDWEAQQIEMAIEAEKQAKARLEQERKDAEARREIERERAELAEQRKAIQAAAVLEEQRIRAERQKIEYERRAIEEQKTIEKQQAELVKQGIDEINRRNQEALKIAEEREEEKRKAFISASVKEDFESTLRYLLELASDDEFTESVVLENVKVAIEANLRRFAPPPEEDEPCA